MQRRAPSRAGRTVAGLFATLAAVVGVSACTGGSLPIATTTPVPTDGRPNIVFVLTDDLSTNLLPYLPHVRALALAGASFEHYFVVDSLCCPSRSAIFTGLFPHDDGVFTNSGSDGGYSAYNAHHNAKKSFAVALQEAGYHTGFMGKYLNGYHPPNDAPAPGWDEWDAAGNGYPEYNYDLNENGTVHHYGSDPADYLTSVLSNKAADFIKGAQYSGKPFALEVATFAPHSPAVPAPEDAGSFPTLTVPHTPAWDRTPSHAPAWLTKLPPLTPDKVSGMNFQFRRRVASMQAVDRMLGRLENVLASTDQLRNTYIVFSSDNGFHMGDYGLRPGKQTAFDTDIRVPLIVAGPGVKPGTTVNSMMSSIDIAPTFLQIAGSTPSPQTDGVSALGLLHGQPAPASWQRAVLIEHHGPVLNPNDPDYQGKWAGDPPSYEAMRTPDALYVEYKTGEREYYDLATDPYELHNLAGSLSPQRSSALHTALQRLAHCHGSVQCQRAAAPPV